MKILYIECNMGAAGDMLMSALLELLPEKDAFIDRMNSLGLEGVHLDVRSVSKCGINGTHISVFVHGRTEETDDGPAHHHHSHTTMRDIEDILVGLPISKKVKQQALEIYSSIAEAESKVHGCPVNKIHFHEVGNMDAVADIVGVCLLMEELSPDRVIVSSINVGSGTVRCSHGVMPVPAPATAHLLRNIPIYGGNINGELCTPTGAALLAHFADEFGPMPKMTVRKIGCGMGKKDFETANCLRIFMGDAGNSENGPNERVAELSCNIDDMTAEALSYAVQKITEAGAKDVFSTPIMMKKGRLGTMISCICSEDEAEHFAALMLRHTNTFGVRKSVLDRYVLERNIKTYSTPLGDVRVKTGEGYGVKRSKLEYEDVASIADKHGLSIQETERRIWLHLNDKRDAE
ncbi:hypothetical protein Mpt1_c07920 [Candidatus Methanoplasma termitum]|uniref:Putative nickel insertion protein n=1 Tax=Candidatus Methanoplasma termitum TaxID=1577791 RepID=A0A0A7LC87_9ARCH|nr:nickel pincer cofactor biosynthesis protein LarC [Candidatus Methanoplasma termitum]AIZ56674.1 hypothetical protein Mpt1_c07920 [Candidatus Methanoplasma termitum]MCL2333318.1 nickel pincer cofactor biosynthesis protein LarC [Candidatus Methanoplasma sp.]